MKGSVKQVAWAEDIKAGAYRALDAMGRNCERFGDMSADTMGFDAQDVEAVRNWFSGQIEAVDDAVKIIDIRYSISQKKLEELAKMNHRTRG